jgi:alpha-glucosidase
MTVAAAPLASTSTRPWWRGAVIYQIYPRSFRDSNGDGIGDLPGVIAGLEHIASLGVDAIWLSPFFTSPMRDFGYDVSDYCDVDPMFGTLADFDRLIDRAHALGLKVLIDQVYSHTSDLHPWFAESRSARDGAKADWYVWADPKPDGSPPSNWQSVFWGPSWTWDARRGQYYLHNFLPEQPDLNVHNPLVQEALLNVARFWLDRGVDGFRLDAVNFLMHDPALRDNPPAADHGPRTRPFDFQEHLFNQSHPHIAEFLERLRALLDEYGGRFTVAEVGGSRALVEMMTFTHGETRLNSAYGFSFLYADKLLPDLVRRAAGEWGKEPDEGWPSWAFSNHDAPRAVSRWASSETEREPLARQIALLLFCLRGNAFLYQGEELGLPQAEIPFERLRDPEAIANWPRTLGRDGARTPLPWRAAEPNAGFSKAEPWLPVDPRHVPLSIDRQEADAASMLQFVRRLVRFRHAHPALIDGDLTLVGSPDPIVAFERTSNEERIFCAFNLGREPVRWTPSDGGWRVVFGANIDAGGWPQELPALSGCVAVRA